MSRLGAILNTASDAVLTVDRRGRIESVNAAAERQFEQSAYGLIGRDVRELLASPHALDQFARIANARSEEAATWELAARRADGSMFPIELTVGRYAVGGNWQYTLVVRDISARREADRSAREHQAALAYVSRLSTAGEMASALAHEMNQPHRAGRGDAKRCGYQGATPPKLAAGSGRSYPD